MSNTIEGVVEKTSSQVSAPGSAKKWTKKGLMVNGKWYNVFVNKDNEDVLARANEGAVVKIETEQNGQYTNVASVEVMSAKEAAASPAAVKSIAVSGEKDFRITYLASRKDALALVAMLIPLDVLPIPTKKADKADAILGYVNYYSDVLAANAMNAKLTHTKEAKNNNNDNADTEGLE